MNNLILVTRPFLPSKKTYFSYVDKILSSGILTNDGALHHQLKEELSNFLGNENDFILTSNGTMPLHMVLNYLGGTGEIITTPFSYIATTSVILWEKFIPVFADINPEYLTIDEEKIEELVTSKTRAILATHVYGNPCAIELIEEIARRHGLVVIYDAAHSFGVQYHGRSIFDFGDYVSCSFHATKIFHTVEGGALFVKDKDDREQLNFKRKFGHNGPDKYECVGTNAKMSELHAAMGLAVLKNFEVILSKKKAIYNQYLSAFQSTSIRSLKIREGTSWNYSYCPFIFPSEKALLDSIKALEDSNIFARRYFYPALNEINLVDLKNVTPIAADLSRRILCLPSYHDLALKDVLMISDIIKSCL